MSSTSHRSPTSIIVATVTTIAVSIVVFRKLWGTRNKLHNQNIQQKHSNSRLPFIDKGIQVSEWEPSNSRRSCPDKDIQQVLEHEQSDSRPQFVDKGIQVSEQGYPNSQPQYIDEDTSMESDHSAGDGGHAGTLIRRAPSTISETQFVDEDTKHSNSVQSQILLTSPEPRSIDQDGKDEPNSVSISAQGSTTSQSHGDIGNEEVPYLQGSSNFQISAQNTTIILNHLNGDGELTKMQRNLICDYLANQMVLPDTNDNRRKHVLSTIALSCADVVFSAYHNKTKSRACYKGTRAALLREMADCITGSSKSKMYILSGVAGIGKTTVAHTIASRAAELNLLGASFFFSRDRTDAQKFFTTIAYQLCLYNDVFSKAIGDALKTKRGSAATTEDHQEQLEALILDPLQRIVQSSSQPILRLRSRQILQSRSRPILIVVDALDECDGEDATSILAGLNKLVQDLPLFKVILTTRPQPFLDRFLVIQSNKKLFHVRNIEADDVDTDIRLFLNYCLSIDEVQKCYPQCQWHASDVEIDSLVHIAIAGGLFIFASIAVRYILDKTASDPAAQMRKLLYAFAQDHTPFKKLDHLYAMILRDVVPANYGVTIRYQSVVGTMILAQHFPVSALVQTLGIDMDDMCVVLDKLQSVILLGSDDVPHICHKSFSDYLTDQARCEDPHIRIDSKICRTLHTQITSGCFKIMNMHLKYNILGLGCPAQFMSNEDGLKENGITDEILNERIPQELRYACGYWVNHFEVANIEDADLMNGFAKFVDEHLLHWFEVLSLIGRLESAHCGIFNVLRRLESTSSDLYQLLSDALRFILKFSRLVKRSALHTYNTALWFTPTNTLLYRRYNKERVDNMCSIEGELKDWDPLDTILDHGEYVNVIKFSPYVLQMISYSTKCQDQYMERQGKLKIWNAPTGTLVSMISGHAFAVTTDLSAVVSAKYKIITCYNVNSSNKDAKYTLTASSKIENLALSSESNRIAAGLSDGSVWLWELRNGKLVDSFNGFGLESHHRSLPQLEFSPDGTRLVYSSRNGIVKLRDGISGRFIADLQSGSNLNPGLFLISSNGTRIASYSSGRMDSHLKLSLWNSESGALIGHRDITSSRSQLAISANGSLLATAGFSKIIDKVTLWNGDESMTQVDALQLQSRIWLLAFSPGPDDILAVATDHNITLYNATTHSLISSLPFDELPTSLAFSPDCTRLAAGSGKGRVHIWDIQDIDAFTPPSEGANAMTFLNHITVLALSRDCSRLACGFWDGTVQLFATNSTKRRIASHRAHTSQVKTLAFSPDGRLFASGPDNHDNGNVKLWNSGDGTLQGTFEPVNKVEALALSKSMLVTTQKYDVTLWSLDTRRPIHTFSPNNLATTSIADNNALIAVATYGLHYRVILLDAINHKIITTFDIPTGIRTMTFLPDNVQLVAQLDDGTFLSFNFTNKHVTKGAIIEHLIHLPNIPVWKGVPMWHCHNRKQHYFSALFSQDKSPIPVLWIPEHLVVKAWAQGRSMIALACGDGRIVLLRLNTNHIT